MDWILQCLFWVSLTLTSAYRSNNHAGYFDYPNYENYDSQEDNPSQLRRVDLNNYQPPPLTWRFDDATYGKHPMSERSAERTNGRPTQRMNERSIAVDSGVQRVQEQERRRSPPRVEGRQRFENGSYKIVNTYPKTYPSVANRGGPYRTSDSVVFPGPISRAPQEYIPEVPEDCLKMGICEDVPNYPTELAEQIISQLGEESHRFIFDVLDEPEIAQRIGPSDNNIELCRFKEKIVMPRAAPDKKGNWNFILNLKDRHIQGYRVEICEQAGSGCNNNIAFFRSGYTGSCKQKFVERPMTAIDKNGDVKFDLPVKVPSCCSCVAALTTRK